MYYILNIVAEWIRHKYEFNKVTQFNYTYRMYFNEIVFLHIYLDFHNDIIIEHVENCVVSTIYRVNDLESPDMFDKLKLAIDHMINDYKLSKRFMARNV